MRPVKHLFEHLTAQQGQFSLCHDRGRNLLWVIRPHQPMQCFTEVDEQVWHALLRCMNNEQAGQMVMRNSPRGTFRPERLYKYIKHEHVDDFLSGKVLISPAERYKESAEKILSMGQIDHEMIKTAHLNTKGSIEGVQNVAHTPFCQISISDDRQSIVLKAEPYWLWCSSMIYDVALFEKRHFDCDACIAITDVEDFSRRLMQVAKSDLGASYGCMIPIDYSSHEDIIGYGEFAIKISHPCGLKRREYERQCEWRLMWTGLKEPPADNDVARGRLLDMGSNRHCARLITP